MAWREILAGADADMAAPDWRLGTCGFSYEDWRGPFYPPDAKPGEYLGYYARYFNAVELDTTFHAAPPPERVRRWAAAVPDGFRFCVKTPREVTHDQPLARAPDPMRRFLDVMAAGMGEKLGAVLIQFPPPFQADQTGRLEVFLGGLPKGIRYAVELRNRSWGTQRTLDLLRATGCALVAAEYQARPRRVHPTADFLYVRWIGRHGTFEKHDREQTDVTPGLEWWRDELARRATGARTVYGFVNNDYAGYSAGTCLRLKRLLGLPAAAPTPHDRGQLFG